METSAVSDPEFVISKLKTVAGKLESFTSSGMNGEKASSFTFTGTAGSL